MCLPAFGASDFPPPARAKIRCCRFVTAQLAPCRAPRGYRLGRIAAEEHRERTDIFRFGEFGIGISAKILMASSLTLVPDAFARASICCCRRHKHSQGQIACK
jgi:hypothetical protein